MEKLTELIQTLWKDQMISSGAYVKLLNFTNTHQALQLKQTAAISWVLVADELPTLEQNGKKVLIYRIMNDSQASQAISIYDTSKVKLCDANETWWMELPAPPC
jgi:hypothetical protein